jgi:hypothetical protein
MTGHDKQAPVVTIRLRPFRRFMLTPAYMDWVMEGSKVVGADGKDAKVCTDAVER